MPTQITLGGIHLEVANFKATLKAKRRLYSRVQAYSDTMIPIGAFNTEYHLSVVVPQDFVNKEDIETTLRAWQSQQEVLVDVEGVGHNVKITNVGNTHMGGQPQVYTVDVSAIEIGPPFQAVPDANSFVAETQNSAGLNNTNDMPMIFFASGLFWSFYVGIGNYIYYQTSPDGMTWSTATQLSASFADVPFFGGGVNYYPALNRFYYGFYYNFFRYFYWRWGTPNSDGTITWGIPEQLIITPYAYQFPTFDVDSTGNFWAATLWGAPFSGGIQKWAIWKNGVSNLMVTQSNVDFQWTNDAPKLVISQTNDNNIAFWGEELATQSTLYYTTDGGTIWSHFNMPRVFSQQFSDAVVVGNIAYIVYPHNTWTVAPPGEGAGQIYFITYNIGDGTTSSETLLDTIPTINGDCPGVSIAAVGTTLIVVYTDNFSNMKCQVSHDLGVTWGAPEVIQTVLPHFGYPPVSVWEVAAQNNVITASWLGALNPSLLPLYAGGVSFT